MRALLLAAIAALAPAAPQTAPPVIGRVSVREKMIALTFDDGPNTRYTPQVIALLKKNGATATFFLIGSQAEQNPQIIRQLHSAGMEIGNHGMRHRYLRADNPQLALQEVQDGQRAIVRAGVARPTLYRFPGGFSGPRTRAATAAQGYRLIAWSVDPRDSYPNTPSAQIVQIVLRDASPGAIVLLHDGPASGREHMLAALSQILPSLRSHGYKICSVGEMLAAERAAS